ncbi:MAG: bifunctional 2-C-methyl-D-erythritol 4-phosphate cytidylyltransferase/2-C-methyl-D-erythritol 2,4-cyclodiphosphate synthase [Sphingomonadales bacterium]|nr:MAG: bifunctional 2-C-methyl-D-erythritol 4-phosphate cytidylyltransferase/2-C-methyl-D-erythritol 2,4-cyclodiphosphate synthase [Sphingomonadales bacterium]
MTDSHPIVAVLVVAAGSGSRFGGDIPKQYAQLGGMSVLRRAILALRAHPALHRIQCVISSDHRPHYDQAVAGLGLPAPVTGGTTRQASVLAGLEALAQDGAPDIVLVHDAARPFVGIDVIDRLLAALREHPGATPALRVVDSLRTGETLLTGELPREAVWRVQTPQAFHLKALLAAHRSATAAFTDDAALLHAAGGAVAFVEGSEDLFKITLAGDMARAEKFLEAQMISRTGMGFDVHQFGPNSDGSSDHVMLCGLRIPHETGLVGHSDADAGLHALTDAILGAIGAGDIGRHFPPSDPKWRGAPSHLFLEHARDLVLERGGVLDHVDLTLICERPKIGPHRDAMVAHVATLLGLGVDQVSIKATTTEKLGFTGRQEGLAAQAIATVRLPSARG